MKKGNDAMKKLIVLVVGILLCSVLSGCVNQAEQNNQKKLEQLTISISDEPHGFFPRIDSYDTLTIGVNFNIFNPLVEFDRSFRIFPKLAKSWNNPNNCTWRFFLRENVTFHNGYPFTADDVKYSIDIIKDNSSSVLRDLITEIKEVHIIDAYTVDIETDQPFPVLLNKLVNIPIVCKRYLAENIKGYPPIGTGAYKFVEYVENDHITLVRNENYSMGHPAVKKVIFKTIQDYELQKDALINKSIDIMEHVPPPYVDEISNSQGLSVLKISNPTVWYLNFDFREKNSSGFPNGKNPLTDLRVRQALYHAINFEPLNRILLNAAEPASQFLSPLIFGYNPEIKRLSYDLNLSRQLLKEAGYEQGFNLTLDCAKEYPTFIDISSEIADQLSEVITVHLNFLNASDYYAKLYMGNCSIYLMGWIPATGDGGEIFDYLLRSERHPLGIGSYNFGHYSNSTIDNITQEITYTMDQNERGRLMRQGFKVAMDDVACIPLYINVCNIGVQDYVVWHPRSDLMTLVEEITVK